MGGESKLGKRTKIRREALHRAASGGNTLCQEVLKSGCKSGGEKYL
jgi:hypothetical protein